MKIIKNILWFLLLAFGIAQFFGPEKNEGDLASVDAFFEDTNPPDDVKTILKNACLDCHSYTTRYPWYSQITPVNYWLANHIKVGKKHFNVSKWNDYDDRRKDHKLDELIEMVERKEMPLESYTWVHSEAKLSEDQIAAINEWASTVRLKYVFLKEAQ
ncbi:heme-binding domain-containing protein [Winogradskyella sediminis]|uniref:Haem-binding domain-containing protein n=1 Tax=Winogradskyella sediminis TaxID=1382466 RepID=A0A1H1N5R1_9FLAO|nr:heme-binding domain-containing protein [Winogradskyella sediminis]SDR93499.1 Haem-binding domain-containing protein [Winogradskyella sediminis]